MLTRLHSLYQWAQAQSLEFCCHLFFRGAAGPCWSWFFTRSHPVAVAAMELVQVLPSSCHKLHSNNGPRDLFTLAWALGVGSPLRWAFRRWPGLGQHGRWVALADWLGPGCCCTRPQFSTACSSTLWRIFGVAAKIWNQHLLRMEGGLGCCC